VEVGIGDDAAVLAAPDGRVVAATDMVIEGRHFRREWSPARDVGRKAAARNLADVAAMGARPTGLLVALAAPGGTPAGWALELAEGIAAEASRAGAAVVGGDTSSADAIMIAVTALGDLGGRPPVTRAGARPGDVVAIAGTLGLAAAGLALLAAGLGAAAADPLASLVLAHRRPRPPYQAGPEAAVLGATSMIDVSDGLLADLGHVASASAVAIDLRAASLLAEPVTRPARLREAAAATGERDWTRWVLAGGDDHALVATFPADAPLPRRWHAIGRVGSGAGILVDGRPAGRGGGWEHFR